MFITKKELEKRIERAVYEAREKEMQERFISERFRDMQNLFDERWRYMEQRIADLELKTAKETYNRICDEPVKPTR